LQGVLAYDYGTPHYLQVGAPMPKMPTSMSFNKEVKTIRTVKI